jgi:hypothetical protein
MVEDVKVVVKYHEVVGVADDTGRRLSGRSLTQDGFEAVEGDVGEEGGEWAALGLPDSQRRQVLPDDASSHLHLR